MSYVSFSCFNISHHYVDKECFSGFSTIVQNGARIALIGNNGSGKSTLLKILARELDPLKGHLQTPKEHKSSLALQNLDSYSLKTVWEVATDNVCDILHAVSNLSEGNIDELIEQDAFSLEHNMQELLRRFNLPHKDTQVSKLSGGERTLLSIVRALATNPDLVLLDEPSNHLDDKRKESLLSFLLSNTKTTIIATHDEELLHQWANTVWYLHDAQIEVFDMSYKDFLSEQKRRKELQVRDKARLLEEKKEAVNSFNKEVKKAAKKQSKGLKKYQNAPKIIKNAKRNQAENTSGQKRSKITAQKKDIEEQLSKHSNEKTLTPRFYFDKKNKPKKFSLEISNASIGYNDTRLIEEINIEFNSSTKAVIKGKNGSGKTSFIKALLNDPRVIRSGSWPKSSISIGYLDQHLSIVNSSLTPLENLKYIRPEWPIDMLRMHLNRFLFFTPQELNQTGNTLSGGQQMRLSLALLSAKAPDLLILDEPTNHLDISSKKHLSEVVNAYPGAILIVSHDKIFLSSLDIKDALYIEKKKLRTSII